MALRLPNFPFCNLTETNHNNSRSAAAVRDCVGTHHYHVTTCLQCTPCRPAVNLRASLDCHMEAKAEARDRSDDQSNKTPCLLTSAYTDYLTAGLHPSLCSHSPESASIMSGDSDRRFSRPLLGCFNPKSLQESPALRQHLVAAGGEFIGTYLFLFGKYTARRRC